MIVAGFGFRASATADSLADALARAARGRVVDRFAAAADRAEAVASALGLAVVRVDAAALAAQDTATRSAAAQAARGTGSLAEAAALAAAGPGSRLLGPRVLSADRRAACALAVCARPVKAET